MTKAKHGDTVKVHYTGCLEDGTIFGSTINREPLQFTIGRGQVIPGFEEAVVGMEPDESKTSKITADKAYGSCREEWVLVVDRNKLPATLELNKGKQLQIPRDGGRTTVVTVTDVSEQHVTLDANHPLAGKDLIFNIRLVQIM